MRNVVDKRCLRLDTLGVSGEKDSSGRIAWNYWYHCIGHAYGSWLPGDARGFRTRHHRLHVDGDYKSPPPVGKYVGLHQYSKSIMTREPVRIPEAARGRIIVSLVDSLIAKGCDVVIASLDAIHFHILARFRNGDPSHVLGIAKKESAYFAHEHGVMPAGGVWAKRAQYRPIRNRAHQLATVRYILNHRHQNAAIWFQGKILPPHAPQ
jgi:hypothetical protein